MNEKNSKAVNKLETALSQIEKLYGKGSIINFGDNQSTFDIESVSTGSMLLDLATGIGGVPRGRIIEIYGPESSGKTTICLHIIAEAQKKGIKVAFIDAEHALDPVYATGIGVDMSKILLSQPDWGEQALDIVLKLTESGEIGVIIVDSVAALVPRAELDGEIGDSHMALQARMMSQSLRMLTGIAQKTNTMIIFINQIRSKIGVMFGNPETTTGGNALKFYASMRFDIRKIGVLKEGTDVVASKTKVKVVKSKVSSPFKEAEFDIRYGTGIDKYAELIEMAIKYDVIKQAGSWLSYGGKNIAQGKEALRKRMIAEEKLYTIIRKKLLGE